MATALILLAAGQGTRMNSDKAKVLHPLAGVPMLWHAMRAGAALDVDRTIVVTGHKADAVREAAEHYNPDVTVVVQDQQLGTGHAVAATRAAFADFDGDVIVHYGDTPLIRPETLAAMQAARADGAAIVVLGFEAANPGRYGRLILGADGMLDAIVEAKDASAEELAVSLCNSGVICANARQLFDLVSEIDNRNAAGEYYLTDIVALANAVGLVCAVVTCDQAETQGINSRIELARAEAAFQTRMRERAMENGATLTAPDTVFFAFDTVIGREVLIGPNVVFGPGVTVESGAEIRAFCHLEGCHISQGAIIGPFARLRPGAEIADNAHIGNFVEVKNSLVGEAAKINHLSYIGDADIGPASNIGAGTITCNYDGVMKHRTKIGAGAFIGSNTTLIAPVTIGEGALTAAGSVIGRDVGDGALAIERSEQVERAGFAPKHMARLRAIKARRNKV